MTTKKGLGRGLSALIPDADMDFLSEFARVPQPQPARKKATGSFPKEHGMEESAPLPEQESVARESVESIVQTTDVNEAGSQQIDVLSIKPNPYQPRRTFSDQEMAELVDSIKTHGVIQPVLVRPMKTGGEPEGNTYQLVAGERRWRAAQAAGLSQISAVIRQVDDQQALELALIENVQRHDISAIDAAVAYQRLSSDFHLSQDQIAQRVGKSRSSVANTLRLLDLPQDVKKSIEDGAISEGHGRAILLATGEGARRAVFRRVIRDKLSVRETERLAQKSAVNTSATVSTDAAEMEGASDMSTAHQTANDLEIVENALRRRLGTRLQVKSRRKGGEIVIHYSSPGELQRLTGLLLNSGDG